MSRTNQDRPSEEGAGPTAAPGSNALARLSNHEVAVVALHRLGGRSERKDWEEIALECYALAPGRFGWRSRDIPSDYKAREALGDAKKPEKGALVAGGNAEGWLLSEDGARWVERLSSEVPIELISGGLLLALEQQRDLDRLAKHWLFESWRNGASSATADEVADAAGLLPDAPRIRTLRRLEQLGGSAASADDGQLKEYVAWLKRQMSG